MEEYILYYRGKIVGGIYDDRLWSSRFPPPSRGCRTQLMKRPTGGAKELLLVGTVDDRAFLAALFEAMYEELPAPKHRK